MVFTREIEIGGAKVLQKVSHPPGISTSKLIDPLFGVGQCNEAIALPKLLDQRPFITVCVLKLVKDDDGIGVGEDGA